jgi:hypothetical protein
MEDNKDELVVIKRSYLDTIMKVLHDVVKPLDIMQVIEPETFPASEVFEAARLNSEGETIEWLIQKDTHIKVEFQHPDYTTYEQTKL